MLYRRKEQNLICCCASTWSTSLHGQPLWVSSTWQGGSSGEQEVLMIQRNLAAWFSRPNGKLVTYGPYAQDGVLTPESNQQVDIKNWSPFYEVFQFDLNLRSRDASWGIRDIRELKEVAAAEGLNLDQVDKITIIKSNFNWCRFESTGDRYAR